MRARNLPDQAVGAQQGELSADRRGLAAAGGDVLARPVERLAHIPVAEAGHLVLAAADELQQTRLIRLERTQAAMATLAAPYRPAEWQAKRCL